MNRRAFLSALAATAGCIVLPWEPKRVYSFARELRVPGSPPEIPILVQAQNWANVINVRSRDEFVRLFGREPPPGIFDPPKFVRIDFGFTREARS